MSIGLMTLSRDLFAGLANWRAKEPGVIITKAQTVQDRIQTHRLDTIVSRSRHTI